MHLNDEQIQRFLHGELGAASKESLSRHLAECRECARALEEAGREEVVIFDLLREIDHPAPSVDAGAFVSPRRSVAATWGRRAAVVVAAVALAGAAYAIPGSPVRELVKRVIESIGGQGRSPQPVDTLRSGEPVTSGISVPANEHFTIHFTGEQEQGVATVSWIDGDMIAVRARGGKARFATDAGRLTIDNAGSAADYEIEVPRDVVWVEVTAGTRRLLLKDGDRLVTDAPVDARGRAILPLSPRGRSGD